LPSVEVFHSQISTLPQHSTIISSTLIFTADKTFSVVALNLLDAESPLQQMSAVSLTSEGVAVRWCNFATDVVMVAEENGVLRLFDLSSSSWLFCMYQPKIGTEALLRSADWCYTGPGK
jgi:hypothetical protein